MIVWIRICRIKGFTELGFAEVSFVFFIYIYKLFYARYFYEKNAVFYPSTVGFSGWVISLLNLILYINDVVGKNTAGMTTCVRGCGIDWDMVFYLIYLTKVGRCFDGEGLLVPTIFRCAVEEGFGYVINIFTLFVVL